MGANFRTRIAERLAADIVVIGKGSLPLLTSHRLARKGKKVLHLAPVDGPDTLSPRHLYPVKLTSSDPLIVHLASESLAYWRGMERTAGGALMLQRDSLDIAPHSGGAAEKLMEAFRMACCRGPH